MSCHRLNHTYWRMFTRVILLSLSRTVPFGLPLYPVLGRIPDHYDVGHMLAVLVAVAPTHTCQHVSIRAPSLRDQATSQGRNSPACFPLLYSNPAILGPKNSATLVHFWHVDRISKTRFFAKEKSLMLIAPSPLHGDAGQGSLGLIHACYCTQKQTGPLHSC